MIKFAVLISMAVAVDEKKIATWENNSKPSAWTPKENSMTSAATQRLLNPRDNRRSY